MEEAPRRYQQLTPPVYAELGRLMADHRQGALATAGPDGPHAAMVAYAVGHGGDSFLVHLSDLSPHKAHLIKEPRCSLLVMEPDDGAGEVMLRRRVAVACQARVVDGASPDHAAARTRYLAAFPDHGRMFDLGDFDLVRLQATGGVFIAGFGRAYRVAPSDLATALATAASPGDQPAPG